MKHTEHGYLSYTLRCLLHCLRFTVVYYAKHTNSIYLTELSFELRNCHDYSHENSLQMCHG